MEGRDVRRSDDQPATKAEGTAAVKSPSDFGSSPAPDTFPSGSSPTLFELGSDAPTIVEGTSAGSAGTSHPSDLNNPTLLRPGTVLGRRYEILQLLGEGGMGAVYRARDREVNRMVALKVIRPELAGNSSILDRFKQELVLSHQVTHKNVVRIYDLGDADGIKFITMEYIEGQNLHSLIGQQKIFPPAEAVEMMRQVCRALEAAHAVGVIHRDLKPQNIMRDKQGRVVVMDFGLARLLDSHDGMTQTGAIVGTMEYMSPEQGLGKPLDERSDLFAVGLIFYELLTGKMPYQADSALASLLKRTHERAVPVSEHSSSVPHALSDIVGKCLEPKLEDRYQHVGEILTDLEAWQGGRAAATLNFPSSSRPWGQTIPWHWIGGGVAVLVLALTGFLLRDKLFRSTTARTPSGPVVSLAILPFRNASGDPALDWLGPSLADMLSTDVGQSAQLRTVSPNRLHQIFTDLRISSTTVLDPLAIRRVADFSSADRVVWGQYAKFGDQIRIDATLQDIKNNRTESLKIDVPSEKEIPGAVDRLAESIRRKLALPEDVLKQLKASSFQPNSSSVAALRDYNQGIGFQRDGKNLEAQKQFEAATKEDPAFALAFSRLAQTYSSLGYDTQAEQSARKAVELSQNLPETEKYLIAAVRAQISKNFPEAIKAYENLTRASPDNTDAQSALAGLYADSGDFAKASEYYQKILSANPKDIAATLEMGRITIKSGNPQASLEPLNHALSLSIQVDNQETRAASLHAIGVAYRMLNKPEEALRNFEQALEVRRNIRQQRGIAQSLNEIARVEASLGKTQVALSKFREALQIRRDIGDKRGVGDTLLDMGNFFDDGGDHDQALTLYKGSLQIERDIGNESLQAICLNNIGSVYFSKGQYQDALTYFQQALQLREKSKVPQDIVESIHNLAETSARMGQYDQAVTQYMRALDLRRSMDDARGGAIESYSLGTLFDYQGRFGAAVNSKQEALKTFRDLKDRTFWMAEILGGYAEALILAGRGQESQPYLDEALSLSRELKNDGLVAQTLDFEGDLSYYRNDAKSARSYYQRAVQAAANTKEPDKVLIAKADLAAVDIGEGRAAAAISSLRSLAKQAEDQGFAYMAVECSLSMTEAMIRSHDKAHAQQELERTLLRTDKLGLKPLSAKAHYLLATVLRESGNQAEAQPHYRNAIELLDAMRKEPGADKILQRSDFKTMHDEASRWPEAAKK